MEIIGYSERGVMNALFYGIALEKEEEKAELAMNKFLELAGVNDDNSFKGFKLYMEFSLSEFGSPDLVFTAYDKDGNKNAFFVEAKASCEKKYDIEEQLRRHEGYLKNGSYEDGHASNIFFQLRLKNYFYNNWCPRGNKKNLENLPSKLRLSRGRDRKLGNNMTVRKFKDELNENLLNDIYVAIIPEQEGGKHNPNNQFGFDIHFVTWEEIFNEPILKPYIQKTITFNQIDNEISQITNKPLPKE